MIVYSLADHEYHGRPAPIFRTESRNYELTLHEDGEDLSIGINCRYGQENLNFDLSQAEGIALARAILNHHSVQK